MGNVSGSRCPPSHFRTLIFEVVCVCVFFGTLKFSVQTLSVYEVERPRLLVSPVLSRDRSSGLSKGSFSGVSVGS